MRGSASAPDWAVSLLTSYNHLWNNWLVEEVSKASDARGRQQKTLGISALHELLEEVPVCTARKVGTVLSPHPKAAADAFNFRASRWNAVNLPHTTPISWAPPGTGLP